MKLSASKFNEKNVFRQFQFLRYQLYAQAYVRIWTLRPWTANFSYFYLELNGLFAYLA